MKKNKIILGLFLGIAAVMFYFDVFHGYSTIKVKLLTQFISILLIFIFSIIFTKKFSILNCAFIFTLLADFCLEVCDPQLQELGTTFFFVVQMFYMFYIFKFLSKKEIRINTILRIILMIIIFIAQFIALGSENISYLTTISVFYIVNFALNIVFAFMKFKKLKVLAIGLTLFIMCDLTLGLNILFSQIIPIDKSSLIYVILHPNFLDLIWLFYWPSQVILCLFLRQQQKVIINEH